MQIMGAGARACTCVHDMSQCNLHYAVATRAHAELAIGCSSRIRESGRGRSSDDSRRSRSIDRTHAARPRAAARGRLGRVVAYASYESESSAVAIARFPTAGGRASGPPVHVARCRT